MSPYKDIPNSAIVTFTGRVIEPLNPDPARICIEDIAHSLANQCRFTGHAKEFYSIAQHSVLVSFQCDPEDALWGLLHDASEAYLADIARPVKKFTSWGSDYLTAEDNLMETVVAAFDLFPLYMPSSVYQADNVLLRTEMRDLMPEVVSDTLPGDTLKGELICWPPDEAKQRFLDRYNWIRRS